MKGKPCVLFASSVMPGLKRMEAFVEDKYLPLHVSRNLITARGHL